MNLGLVYRASGNRNQDAHRNALTFSKASLLPGCNLGDSQGFTVNLQTGNAAFEVAAIPLAGSHARRIIGRQENTPPDVLHGDGFAVHVEFGHSSRPVVGRPDILPPLGLHLVRHQIRRRLQSPSAVEANEQSAPADHPEMDAPRRRVVVEYRPGVAFVFDPSQQGDGLLRVQPAVVGELYVAVWSAEELRGRCWSLVGARSWAHVLQSAGRVAEHAHVSALRGARQRINSSSTKLACVQEEDNVNVNGNLVPRSPISDTAEIRFFAVRSLRF